MRRILVGALLAGCASSAPQTPAPSGLFAVQCAQGPGERVTDWKAPGPCERLAYRLEVRFEDGSGTPVLAPEIIAWPRLRAQVQFIRKVAYIEDFDIEISGGTTVVDPGIGIVENGLSLEMHAWAPADRPDRIAVAFSARVVEALEPYPTRTYAVRPGSPPVTVQTPSVVRSEADGMRLLEPGVTSLLARLPAARGGGATSILLRVSPTAMPEGEPEPGEAAEPLPAAMGESAVLLRLRPVILRRALPAGSVLDEAATAAAIAEDSPAPLAGLEVVTTLAPGVRVAHLLDEPQVVSWENEGCCAPELKWLRVEGVPYGLEGRVQDGGGLRLVWTPVVPGGFASHLFDTLVREIAPPTDSRAVELRPARGPRLAVLFAVDGGGTAAVLVECEPLAD